MGWVHFMPPGSFALEKVDLENSDGAKDRPAVLVSIVHKSEGKRLGNIPCVQME